MTLPARAAFRIPAQPSTESGRNWSGIEVVVVDAPVDDVDALLARGRAHEDALVAAHEVATLDQLDAHLAREERVLEVRRVVQTRREHDDARLVDTRRRGVAQRLEEMLRVVGDTTDAVAGEQLGEHVRHRPPVLHDVGDPRRRAQVVLEHPEGAGVVADEVDPGDVDAHAPGRLDAGDAAVEVLRAGDEPARHDAVGQDLAGAVHVGEEALERQHPLAHARLDPDPLRLVDDPRHEVERERPLLTGERERDALVAERPVPARRTAARSRRATASPAPSAAPRRAPAGDRARRTSRPMRPEAGIHRGDPPPPRF